MRLHQTPTQTITQFAGGGVGESDHQYLLHCQRLFQNQPQVESGDGPGLAGAGAGFDQGPAIQLHGFGPERFPVHGFIPPAVR